MTERETVRDRLMYLRFTSIDRLTNALPETAGRAAFALAARIAYRVHNGARETVAANLSRVLGCPADSEVVLAATREAFARYGRYWFEAFRMRSLAAAELNKRFAAEGVEHLDRALEAGRGAVAVVPHMGNWDAAGFWLAENGYRVATVAEQLQPVRLAEWFRRRREAVGMRVIPLSPGGRVGHQLAALLADNWLVGLVADRDLSGRGVEVEMFGAPRRLPAGPALLSLTSGAPLLPCELASEGGWSCRIGEPIVAKRTGDTRADVRTLTAEMARRFEQAIAAHPTDWHMFQPAWDR